MEENDVKISHVLFKNFKALRYFSIHLHQMNILVGPNNCGKSTVISAFRILDVAVKIARWKSAEFLEEGKVYGYELSPELVPVSLENIHTNYAEEDTSVTFYLTNKNKLILLFPKNGGCILLAESENFGRIRTPGKFKQEFPIQIVIVPVMGQVEHEEEEVTIETVKKGFTSHRASRHFRNYWRYFPDDFGNFSQLIKDTWKGMEIEKPYKVDPMDTKLAMFCIEDRIPREIFWAGSGFQIWCQLLTHISRAKNKDIIIIDEPEIYLHPEVQRQLIGILRDLNIDVLIATHSTEMLAEAEANEILVINKYSRSAKRLKDVEGVQSIINKIGSIQNIILTQLAKNRRILFVESTDDFKIIRRFAKKNNFGELSTGVDITTIESRGFSSWERIKSFVWGFKTAFREELHVAAIFDRDYWCDEEIDFIEKDLSKELDLIYILRRKEIENFLLDVEVLQRVLDKLLIEKAKRTCENIEESISAKEFLDEITLPLKSDIQGKYLSKRVQYFHKGKEDDSNIIKETIDLFEKRWETIEDRMKIVPGKDVLSSFRERIQNIYGISISNFKIINEFRKSEISKEMNTLIEMLEDFRNSKFLMSS